MKHDRRETRREEQGKETRGTEVMKVEEDEAKA